VQTSRIYTPQKYCAAEKIELFFYFERAVADF
jgi:hypothetical protein